MPTIIIAIFVLIADQWSKYYIQTHMTLGQSIPLWPNVFHLTYILNPGAAFGMLANQRWFFILVAVMMVAAAVYYYRRLPDRYVLVRTALGLIAGGAVGNVIDRLQTGYVVDFFDFRIWPIFNIADSAIVVGVGLIIYTIIFLTKEGDLID